MTCNRCGVCCERGGPCVVRKMTFDGRIVSQHFEGRCEFLRRENDGTQTCTILERCDQDAEWFRQLIPGTCNWPELKKEIEV